MTAFVMPNGQVGIGYSKSFELNGDFELDGFNAPDGMAVKKAGRSIIITGIPTAPVTAFSVVVGIKQCCCNGQSQSFNSNFTVAA